MESEHRRTVDEPANYALARRVADELTDGLSTPPIDVQELVESNGLGVQFDDFGQYGSDVAGLIDFDKRRLLVNNGDIGVRQRFTMAHEFGHWMLHRRMYEERPDLYNLLPRFQSTPDKRDPREQEANAFAANLLVPFRLLRRYSDQSDASLARLFAVSQPVIGFRRSSLKYE